MSKNGSAGNDRKRIYIKSFYRKNRICFFSDYIDNLMLERDADFTGSSAEGIDGRGNK